MKLNYLLYSLCFAILILFLKLNIDSLLNKPIEPDELKDYNYKMKLVFNKVYDVKIKDDSEIANFIKSLNKRNEILIDLIYDKKNNSKDDYISFVEYKNFKEKFNSLYMFKNK